MLCARIIVILLLLVLALFFPACAKLKPNETKIADGGIVRVPDGFTIESLIPDDKAQYPMLAAFDDRGRLFVAESSGKNIKGRDMPKFPECRISVFEDKDGDGFFESSKVFADKLSLPMGVLWHQGSLFVASPPDFFRFDDKNDDGVADNQTAILTGWNVLNTASLHGPFLGPDGWLYLTHGRHGYEIQTKEGTQLKGLASRIWRTRADGTGLERFAGGGFDNPVEIMFTPAGEMIGTMTYYMDPQNGQRDALMHFVEGGVYPKPHPSISEFKRTGELMPVMTKFARIAPSGLMQYRSASFGAEYQGNLFTAQFNPHRFQRHILHRDGATFRTEDSDFVTSDDPDFHPTEILEDADGSLIVIDTGGWYVDACPISRVAKAERRGGIYRIRKTGAEKIADPRGRELKLDAMSPNELVNLLSDPRFAVRDRALEKNVTVGAPAIPALTALREKSSSPETRCSAVFALGRIGSPEAINAARAALTDVDLQVRIAAARVAGVAQDRDAVPRLLEIISKDELPVRRQAAAALGQIGDVKAVAALLNAADTTDRFVEHAAIYSLILLKQSAPLLPHLKNANPKIRKAALIALDQMDGSPLTAKQVTPLLDASEAEVRRAALFVLSHHNDWGDAVVGYLQAKLQDTTRDALETEAVKEALIAFAANQQVQNLIAASLGNASIKSDTKIILLEAIERSNLKELPENWLNVLRTNLQDSEAKIRTRTIATIRARSLNKLDDAVNAMAANANELPEIRVAAIGTLLPRQRQLAAENFNFLLGLLKPERDPALRLSAAQNLGQAELQPPQLLQLAEQYLPQADSVTLQALLSAFRQAKDEQVGKALIAALNKPAVDLTAIGGKRLEELFQDFPGSVKAEANTLLLRFKSEETTRIEKLRQMESSLNSGGDEGNGRRIFFGNKVACYNCHAIGNEGSGFGPDLTKIGAIRSGHDILEAIVFPNASQVPGHETQQIMTKSGAQLGIIKEAESDSDSIALYTSPASKIRVPRQQISAINPAPNSLMPEGLAAMLTQKELTDLLAFLKAQK